MKIKLVVELEADEAVMLEFIKEAGGEKGVIEEFKTMIKSVDDSKPDDCIVSGMLIIGDNVYAY